MPLIPREKIDDVRDRTNIVEVIKRYVELKRAGTGSWKGLCPFHAEKTPSFHVHEVRQFFHCFGCGEKGDVFAFLAKIEQRSFTEVLRDLAQQSGVELPEREQLSPAERRAREAAESERDRLLRVMDLATTFFEDQYASTAGVAARAYVEGRGIGPEVRARFRVGYAPPHWGALMEHLARHKVSPADAERLGLVGANERGRYDFFRDRVMLPVFDRQKRVVGFGSRLLDPQAKDRKYVNSPDSPLFHKKECLYGLHAALDAVRKSGTAVVVEGNFDVLALHQAGIEEAVAPMGTALTGEQVGMLARLARRAVVIFDGDAAGKRAAEKAVPLFVEAELDGYVARLPVGQDPDDYVRERGPEGAAAFRQLLDTARPMIDQFIQDAAAGSTIPDRPAEAAVASKLDPLETISGLLARVKNPTHRELYVQRVAAVLGVSAHQVNRQIRTLAEQQQRRAAGREGGTTPAAPAAAAKPAHPERALPRDELELLALLGTYPEFVTTPEGTRAGDLLVDPAARRLFAAASEAIKTEGRLDVPAWMEAGPAEVRRSLSRALMDSGVSHSDNPAAKLRALSVRLELQRVEAEISMTARLLNEARTRGDSSATQAMILRGVELDKTKLGLKQALQRP